MQAGNRAGFIPEACDVFGCCIKADQNCTINQLLNNRSWYYVEPTSRETKKKGRTDVCSVVFTLRQQTRIAYISRNNQSITIDKSIKIGKSDLIHIHCIDQSVAWIDDTLVAFIALTWFLPIYLFICSSKNENWFHANSKFVDSWVAIESRRIKQLSLFKIIF